MKNNLIVIEKKYHDLFNEVPAKCIEPLTYILNNDVQIKYRVYNLSSDLGYQHLGYYVSLLAAARNQKIIPSVQTIQDLKDRTIQRIYSDELHELIQTKLKRISTNEFEFSVYFGENLTESYNSLAWELYRIIQAPLFRVYFIKENEWILSKIKILNFPELTKKHQSFFIERLKYYFSADLNFRPKKNEYLYDLAILVDRNEDSPPSDAKAIKKFVQAFRKCGFWVEVLEHDEFGSIAEYDALFIRETTNVRHHTYRLANKAEKEGLVVIDDPESILRCTNKIFLEQMLDRLKIKRPKTNVFDRSLFYENVEKIKLPCVIKKPDSAFSLGVHKANTKKELIEMAESLFKTTDLILTQEFLPSDYDWRIGILGGEVLFACKYYMANGHWQIINNNKNSEEGESSCIDLKDVDAKVLKTALKAANAIGKGLYGVDLKQINNEVYLIEVNDNPSLEFGVEDELLGDRLYEIVANHFLKLCHLKKKVL